MFINGVKGEKVFTIFGGVNGVGKSTLRNKSGVQTYIIDPDDISRNTFGDYRKATLLENKLMENFINSDMSFGRETTLTGKTIFKKITYLKGLGYKINLVFIHVNDVNICIKRVAKRVREGGHDIPTIDIERRYDIILSNLKANLYLFDTITFYDNTKGDYKLVGLKNGDIMQELVKGSYLTIKGIITQALGNKILVLFLALFFIKQYKIPIVFIKNRCKLSIYQLFKMLVFILMNDENAEYVTISYPRMKEENIEFKQIIKFTF